MKLRLKSGTVIEVMPYPKHRRGLNGAEFAADLKRWMSLTLVERRAVMERMKRYRRGWVYTHARTWAAANLTLPTLPCEGVTVVSYSEAEEDALRAYWDGWMEQSEKIWSLRWQWPTLPIAQRADALVLA